MSASSRMRFAVILAAGAGLLVATALQAQPAAGPWAKVPALPTACYVSQEQDQFQAKLEVALAAVQADHYKQNDINGKIREDAQNVDPMELARRMQEYMMKDPQGAMKYMQDTQNLGQGAPAAQQVTFEKEAQLEAEEKALIQRYRTALAKSYAPGNARWDALKKKAGIAPDSRGPGESGVPDWVWKEWEAILREWDKAYQATCAQWWTAAGPMHAYLKRYKDYLVQERIPHHQKLVDEPTLKNYQVTNVSSKGYRSVADFVAVEDYIKRAWRIFDQRMDRPRCTAKRCDG